MPGPAPKPADQRQRRPNRDIPWVDLPAEGRADVPRVPAGSKLRAAGKRWWKVAWSTPSATQWGDAEMLLAVKRAQLEDQWDETRDPKWLTESRHLDTALGLTAKARKELRWRIVGDDGAVVEDGAGGSVSDIRRRLRVLDDPVS